MLFRSRAERRWWSAAGAVLATIYGTLYSAQSLLDALRQRNLLRVAIGVAAALAATALVVALRRRRAGWREWAAWAVAALVGAGLAARLEVIQERIHLLEYGGVALIFLAALEARSAADGGTTPAGRLYVAAGVLTALAGWLDEAIQGVLPNRVYDLRDVRLNALAGALALGALALARRMRSTEAKR